LQQKLQDIVVLRAPPKMIGSEEERKRRAEDGLSDPMDPMDAITTGRCSKAWLVG
jgi:hypothetical protein